MKSIEHGIFQGPLIMIRIGYNSILIGKVRKNYESRESSRMDSRRFARFVVFSFVFRPTTMCTLAARTVLMDA